MHADATRGPSPKPRGPGPLLLILPLLGLCLGILWARQGHLQPLGERPEPPPTRGLALLPGWAGEIEVEPGLVLRARLMALHSDPRRQAFDRDSLRACLGLPAGQPWRLYLELSQPAGPLPEAGAGLDLEHLAVRGAGDVLIGRLRPGVDSGAAPQPLATLLGRTPMGLPSGAEVMVLLWGEDPGPHASLIGLGEPLELTVAELTVPDHPAELVHAEGLESAQ